MALSITQTPALVSLAQSPIIFTLSENTPVYTSSSFQYVGELFYWTGSLTNSSSVADYTITKYPNTSNVGIFDLNRIINSTLTDLAIANTSNVQYFAADFYWQYFNGSTYVTGSHVKSSTFKALDGYGIFQEPIGQNLTSSSVHWPLMTNGPATQSAFTTNRGTSGVYTGTAGGTSQPTKIVYTSNLGSADYNVSSSTATSGQIYQYPIGPAESGFPLSTSGLTYYTTQAFSGSTALGLPIKYEIDCIQKYPNVRVKWKNRFGQFDYFNFYMVNKQSFETEKRTYQPQLGTWEASTLSYQNYDTGNQAYIVDSKQGISVNSFWINESYNDILKQLLVSDEIYWVYDESNNIVRPLTIVTQNIVFKTGVVDGLIQYQFDFQYGQPYKLIL
jgi:hypothetical protein